MRKLVRTLLKWLLIPVYMLGDSKVAVSAKVAIVGAVAYLLLPVDLIPDFLIPVVGYADDAAAIAACYKFTSSSVTEEHKQKAEEKAKSII